MGWETVKGNFSVCINNPIVTYSGGPAGSYVYLWKERDPGWHHRHQTRFQHSAHTKILSGQVATKFEDAGCEHIVVLPGSWESLHLLGSDDTSERS